MTLQEAAEVLKATAADRAPLLAEVERLRAIEGPLRAWVERQCAENAHCLYRAALKHFDIQPVIPD
jgi:hypothetical protein